MLMSGRCQIHSVAEGLAALLYCSCSNKMHSNVRNIAWIRTWTSLQNTSGKKYGVILAVFKLSVSWSFISASCATGTWAQDARAVVAHLLEAFGSSPDKNNLVLTNWNKDTKKTWYNSFFLVSLKAAITFIINYFAVLRFRSSSDGHTAPHLLHHRVAGLTHHTWRC